MILKKFLLSLMILFVASYSWAGDDTYYVRPISGEYGAEDGTTYATAFDGFADISWSATESASAVDPGDTLYVCGTHSTEYLTPGASGTSGNYITIRGDYAGDAGVIDPNKVALYAFDYGLIELIGKDYMHVISMTVKNGTKQGIRGSSCDYVIIEDCTVELTDYGGINFNKFGGAGGGTNITIDGCIVNHANDGGVGTWHEDVSLENVDTFEIKNCIVYDGEKEGIDCKYGCSNGSIHHCTVYNNAQVGIYVDGSTDIDIYNNLVYGNGYGIGVWIEDADGGYDTGNINIYNNIVRDCGVDGINLGYIESGVSEDIGLHDVTVINNTIENCTGSGLQFDWYADGHSGGKMMYGTNVVRNNIFWENGKEIDDETSGDAIITDSVVTIDYNLFKTGATTDTTGSSPVETADVKFVDQSGNDFHLQIASPAKDAGNSTGAPSTDYDDASRPQGAGYDIGGYEYWLGTGIAGPGCAGTFILENAEIH